MKIHRPTAPMQGSKNNPLRILPYLPPQTDGYFDSRHNNFSSLDEPFPFSLTTREAASNQKFIITYKTMKARIRKITPRECFRLMGVGESQIDTILSVVSNSAAYALAGNSIVAGGNYTDENGNVDGVLYNIFRKLLVETGRDKQQNDQLSLF